MAPDSTCILVPTFPRQLPAARLTVELLNRYWPNHPEIFICGVETREEDVLPLTCDPADWIAVVLGGARELARRGYVRVFLILDDQGPIEACHEEHLNVTIPAWMTEFDAVYISLRGWDHRRNSSGKSLGEKYLHLQRQSATFPWRFALHPALWRLDVLIEMLAMVGREVPIEQHSAWAFERRAGRLEGEVAEKWGRATYRVHGRRMMKRPLSVFARTVRHWIDGVIRNIDLALREPPFLSQKWPISMRRLLARVLMTDDVRYQGPYPMFFSGFLIRGRINPHMAKFLYRSGQRELLGKILAVVPGGKAENSGTRVRERR